MSFNDLFKRNDAGGDDSIPPTDDEFHQHPPQSDPGAPVMLKYFVQARYYPNSGMLFIDKMSLVDKRLHEKKQKKLSDRRITKQSITKREEH